MAEPRGGVKTLAIQLTDDQHAQLFLIAQVERISLKDVLKQAVDALIAAKRTGPDFAARAQAVLEEIDREAASRRQAIQTLFATDETPAEPDQPTARRSRRGGESSES